MLASLFSTIIALVCYLPLAAGQVQQHAVCTVPSANWTFNSLNQSPCLVAEYLGGVCSNGIYNIPPLNPSQFYSGPAVNLVNNCRCSSVMYSMLGACAFCQDRTVQKWSIYNLNCTTDNGIGYPEQIPAGTAVPAYAYLDVKVGDTFNPVLAQLVAAPESTAPPKPTVDPSLTSIPISSPSTSTNSSSGSPSKAGPIAGGVVGGIVLIGLLVVLAFLWRRRRSSQALPPHKQTPQADLLGFDNPTASFVGYNSPTPVSYTTPSSPYNYPVSGPVSYSRHDVNGFSVVPTSPSSAHTNLDNLLSPSIVGSAAQNPQRTYTGAPEV